MKQMYRLFAFVIMPVVVATIGLTACDSLFGSDNDDPIVIGSPYSQSIGVTFTRNISVPEFENFAQVNKLVSSLNVENKEWTPGVGIPAWRFDLAPDHEPQPDSLSTGEYLEVVADNLVRQNPDLVKEAQVVEDPI
jgi:hypothetical protein